MSENLRDLTKAVYGMDAVVRRIPDGSWDSDSPCDGWTARDVLGHQVGVLNGVAHMAAGNDMILPTPPEDLANPVELWSDAVENVLTALDQRGALHHSGQYWFGPMSIDGLIGIVKWDPLTHAWDLGQATGIEAILDEGLAQKSFDTISGMRPALVKMRLVAEDPVDVADDADIVSRYLALVGRIPMA